MPGLSGLGNAGMVRPMHFREVNQQKRSRVAAMADQIKGRFGQADLRRGNSLG